MRCGGWQWEHAIAKRYECEVYRQYITSECLPVYFWYDQTLRRTSETSATYRTWKQDLTPTTSLSRQPVQGIVTLTVSTDLAAKRERGGGGQGTAVGIDVNDGNLDGRVVLRGDEAVWRRLQSAQQNRIFCPVAYEHSLVAAHLRGT